MLTLSEPLRELFAQGGTLLVPSRQRAAAARLAWASENLQAGRRSWITPNVLTPAAWLQQQLTAARQQDGSVPRVLGAAEEWVLWQRAAAELTADGSALLSEDALARALRASAQLTSDYGIARTAIEAAAGFDLESAWLLAAMQSVERAAAQVQALPLHRALPAAAALPASSAPLRTLGIEPLPQAWAVLLQRCGAVPLSGEPLPSAGQVCSVQAVNAAAELRSAAQWCREKLAQSPQARLRVVIPDLARVRDSVTQLWRDTLCASAALGSDAQHELFVLEGGEPLAAYPWIAQALDGIAVLARPLPVEQVANWLLSPFWSAATRGPRAELAEKLRRFHFQPCTLQDVLNLLPAADGAADSAARGLRAALALAQQQLPSGRQLPRDWAQSFSLTLAALGCIAEAADSALAQQLRARWQELLEDFATAGRVTGALSAGSAAALLAQLARQASFAPATGDPAIIITASLEHPVVNYDGIWVCRCSAAAWPAAAVADPFLPRALQAQCGVREASATGQLAIAADQLRAWRECSTDLRLSWAEFIDDAAAEASALLQSFPAWQPQQRPADALRLLRAAAQPATTFEDDAGPVWNAEEFLPGGSRSMELQSDCAFRAFAELRLGATALELAEPGIDRRERGKLLHQSLDIFWRQTLDLAGLRQLGAAALSDRIAAAVAQASALQRRRLAGRGEVAARDWRREEARTRRQIERLCEFEKQRTPFRVAASEYRLDARIARARLRLRFDRVDALDDGVAALIDYKSSDAPQGSRWLSARPAPVQLLVYLAALPDGRIELSEPPPQSLPVAALATLHVGRRTPKFHGVSDTAQRLRGVARAPDGRGWKGPSARENWTLQREFWARRISTLAQQFLDGRAIPDPEAATTCRYCELTALCRRVERVRFGADTDEEETEGDSDASERSQ